MAVKLHYLFKKTADPIEFLNYHNEVFLNLLKTLPNLQAIEVNRVKADSFGGEPSYFLITEAKFSGKKELEKALKSVENESLNKVLANFAKGYVTILVSEELEKPEIAKKS